MRIPVARRERSTAWVLQFINIVFLMLLFFMVNGTISTPLPAGVEPPVSILSEAANPPEFALFVSRDGTLTYRGQTVSPGEFAELVTRAGREETAPRAIVADRRLAARTLIDLLVDFQARQLPPLPVITLKEEP